MASIMRSTFSGIAVEDDRSLAGWFHRRSNAFRSPSLPFFGRRFRSVAKVPYCLFLKSLIVACDGLF